MRIASLSIEYFLNESKFEIEKITSKEAKIDSPFIITDELSDKVAQKLCIESQSSCFLMMILFEGKMDLDEMANSISKVKIEFTFRIDMVNFSDDILRDKLASKILSTYKCKVDLDRAELRIAIGKMDSGYVFGIDLIGFDITKRQYKLFGHSQSIKGPLGFGMIMQCSNFSSLMDPFCNAGVIPIEAAIYKTGSGVRQFEARKFHAAKIGIFTEEVQQKKKTSKVKIFALDPSVPMVSFARRNAQLANVHKSINFSRMETEWLDIKTEKNSIDALVCTLPRSATKKTCEELLYQAEYILSTSGKIVVLCKKEDMLYALKKHTFKSRIIETKFNPIFVLER